MFFNRCCWVQLYLIVCFKANILHVYLSCYCDAAIIEA
ncbi:unnamed protein product [Nezara viridula]|uniref:Uncharacterized protein n=1 Tax=Nezara viridula TaxID=85310 RepID=A0A9P0E647_NEZVI|nr:unnamed protein product [Nezara viridula]